MNQEMLAKLRALAPTVDTLDFNSGITGTQTYTRERHAIWQFIARTELQT